MCYIPSGWIRNKDNEKEIFEILDYIEQDVVTKEILAQKEVKVERLKEMGEDILYAKLKNNEIDFC